MHDIDPQGIQMMPRRRVFILAIALGFIAVAFDGVSADSSDQARPTATMHGKVFTGYQGWFSSGDEGGRTPWRHYGHNGRFEPGSVTIDLWPDVSELTAEERVATPFSHADGRTAEVFSSANPLTVDRHFKWMKQHGIDGVFLQRFGVSVADPDIYPFISQVLANVRASAEQHERQWAVMYDLSSLRASGFQRHIIEDWQKLVGNDIRDDRHYIQHDGKPVVAIWGVGFTGRSGYNIEDCLKLVRFFKNDPTYGGNTVIVGVPYWWRQLGRDTVDNPKLHELLIEADIVMPWSVGRTRSPDEAIDRGRDPIALDIQWTREHNLDYMPVIFPGFSWYNMQQARGSDRGILNEIPRLGGQFLWSQAVAAKRAGAKIIYVAMFDEIDEGTAIFKVTNDPPVGPTPFATYEGLPSDHYLWLTGQIARMLREEIPSDDQMPERQ